jgi:lipoprotein LpqH
VLCAATRAATCFDAVSMRPACFQEFTKNSAPPFSGRLANGLGTLVLEVGRLLFPQSRDLLILPGHTNRRRSVVKRGFVFAVSGTAIVATALTGCGGNDNKSSSNQSASVSVPGGGSASAGSGTATVKVDGKETKLDGMLACADVPGTDTFSMTIGNPPQVTTAVVTKADPPEENQVVIYLSGQTTPVSYNKGSGGDATATKDGKKYTISGHSTPMPDMSNPMGEPKGHEFSLEVTCP